MSDNIHTVNGSSYFWTSVNQFNVCFYLAWDSINIFSFVSSILQSQQLFCKRKGNAWQRLPVLDSAFFRDAVATASTLHKISTVISEIQLCWHILLLLIFLPSSVSHSCRLKHLDSKPEHVSRDYLDRNHYTEDLPTANW